MRLSATIACVLLALGCGSARAADYLYSPQPVQDSIRGDGVLVREVTIRKGDTLSALSKRFSGRGYYYPQILLFSEIKNPHRIYPGQIVRVPLARRPAHPPAQAETSSYQNAKQPSQSMVVADQAVQQVEAPRKKESVRVSRSEKKLFNAAHAALQQGRCDSAIKQFDRFIARYPLSSLLPEATLYRAECYLKLSEK